MANTKNPAAALATLAVIMVVAGRAEAARRALLRRRTVTARAAVNWVRNNPGDHEVARAYWVEAGVLMARAADLIGARSDNMNLSRLEAMLPYEKAAPRHALIEQSTNRPGSRRAV